MLLMLPLCTMAQSSMTDEQVFKFIIKERKLRVEISGHTDSTGDQQKNMVLSKQRAESVRTFLIKQGCDASLLVSNKSLYCSVASLDISIRKYHRHSTRKTS